MNNQYPPSPSGPLFGIIKFLAVVGLLTIFGLGIVVGASLVAGGF